MCGGGLVFACPWPAAARIDAGRPSPCPLRLLASNQLTEKELALVTNLSIETADEARKLVPTLDVRARGRVGQGWACALLAGW